MVELLKIKNKEKNHKNFNNKTNTPLLVGMKNGPASLEDRVSHFLTKLNVLLPTL